VGGAALSGWVLWGSGRVGHVGFGVDTLLVAGFISIAGYQVIVFALFTKIFAIREGLHPEHRFLARIYPYARLETGLLAGAVMTVVGVAILVLAFTGWASKGFGSLNPAESMRAAIPGCVLLALGVQTIFASFFLSILGVPAHEIDRRSRPRDRGLAEEAQRPGR